MENKVYDKKAKIFKALSNPIRLRILDILLTGEKCVCEIIKVLGLEQSHVSKNLTILKEAGLIEDRKEGLKVFYKLKICCLKDFMKCLNKIL